MMKKNTVFTALSLFLGLWTTFSYCATHSLLLFFLEDNQLTIERYAPDEFNQETKELSTNFRKGHTLYTIDMSDIVSSQSKISFSGENSLSITSNIKNTYQYKLLWPSLISKKPSTLPTQLTTVSFAINTDAHGMCELTGFLDAWGFPLRYKFTTDKPIQSACGIFLDNTFFDYDKGLFCRSLTISQRDEYGILYQCKKTTKRKNYKNLTATSIVTKSILLPIYYTVLCANIVKKGTEKTAGYVTSTLSTLAAYFKTKEKQNIPEPLQQNLNAEEEFDKLLEETMDVDLDFISTKTSAESSRPVQWLKGIGAQLFMRYLWLEDKVTRVWKSNRE